MPKKKWDEPGEKITTYVPQSHKVDLKIKLKYHGVTQSGLLRGVVKAFLQEDAQFMAWFDDWKLRNSRVQGKKRRSKSAKLDEKGRQLASKFGINEGEIEDIFDVIAEEHPEL